MSDNAMGGHVLYRRSSVCVVNTHIYSNYQRGDVKLWQTLNLLREIQTFVTARDLALLICGDFNSEPHSAVYDFITHGALQQDLFSYIGKPPSCLLAMRDVHMLTDGDVSASLLIRFDGRHEGQGAPRPTPHHP